MTMLFIGMVATNHWQHGFFMNWMGDQKGEGFEFHALAIGISMAILASGSGSYSVDAMLSRKAKTKTTIF
jgi:putative oxidoreductase